MTIFQPYGSIRTGSDCVMPRYLTSALQRFSEGKMVLISGPRQTGKTTLAQEWSTNLGVGRSLYLNWDAPEHRQQILSRSFLAPLQIEALVLDEFHKYSRWKSWLKGVYDLEGKRLRIVVTGSARLEMFQKGGESLFGRYEHLRLHPFSLGELVQGTATPPPRDWLHVGGEGTGSNPEDLWRRLEAMGGFPEPYTRNDPLFHRRWSMNRRRLLLQEDLRDISQIREVSLVEHLMLLLPGRVGSPLSVNALREELQVAHDTVSSWLRALDRLYLCFRISPYSRRISRSLKKEQKLYLWDWSQVEDPAARFENMVACHLLKAAHLWTDLGYGEFELHYLRDREKHEVDFLLSERNKPVVLFECKEGDETPAPSLLRLGEQLGELPKIQLLSRHGVDKKKGSLRVVSASRYLAGLA